MHTVILTVLTIKILNFYESTMVAVAFSQKNRKTAIYTDIHHPTPSVLSNKTASIVKQNWNQFLFVVIATALKQHACISNFYPQIQRTDITGIYA